MLKKKLINISYYFSELLLGQLTEYMKTVRKDFLIHSGSEKDTSAVSICTPELINNITWIRQLDAKVMFCLLYHNCYCF